MGPIVLFQDLALMRHFQKGHSKKYQVAPVQNCVWAVVDQWFKVEKHGSNYRFPCTWSFFGLSVSCFETLCSLHQWEEKTQPNKSVLNKSNHLNKEVKHERTWVCSSESSRLIIEKILASGRVSGLAGLQFRVLLLEGGGTRPCYSIGFISFRDSPQLWHDIYCATVAPYQAWSFY